MPGQIEGRHLLLSPPQSSDEDYRIKTALSTYASLPNNLPSDTKQPTISAFNLLNALRDILNRTLSTVQIAGLIQVLEESTKDFQIPQAAFVGALKTFDFDQPALQIPLDAGMFEVDFFEVSLGFGFQYVPEEGAIVVSRIISDDLRGAKLFLSVG
jgi:hypothetical protein